MLPFKYAERNFYRAAQCGLDARLLWPSSQQVSVVEYSVRELAQRFIPLAQAALEKAGMQAQEVQRLMNNIHDRLAANISGACWQKITTQQFENAGMPRADALQAMLQNYRQHFKSGQSIAHWSTAL